MRWTKQGIHLNLRTNDVANFQKLYSIIRKNQDLQGRVKWFIRALYRV